MDKQIEIEINIEHMVLPVSEMKNGNSDATLKPALLDKSQIKQEPLDRDWTEACDSGYGSHFGVVKRESCSNTAGKEHLRGNYGVAAPGTTAESSSVPAPTGHLRTRIKVSCDLCET